MTKLREMDQMIASSQYFIVSLNLNEKRHKKYLNIRYPIQTSFNILTDKCIVSQACNKKIHRQIDPTCSIQINQLPNQLNKSLNIFWPTL